jgi:hypothetical protein
MFPPYYYYILDSPAAAPPGMAKQGRSAKEKALEGPAHEPGSNPQCIPLAVVSAPCSLPAGLLQPPPQLPPALAAGDGPAGGGRPSKIPAGATHVLPGCFLGSGLDARDQRQLAALRIGLVLNFAGQEWCTSCRLACSGSLQGFFRGGAQVRHCISRVSSAGRRARVHHSLVRGGGGGRA